MSAVGDVVQVQATARSAADADALVASLLDRRLIACGQRIGPVASRYWWHGRQVSAQEWIVVLKTTAARAGDVVDAVAAAHPDEVPEILVLPGMGGDAGYLTWVAEEVHEPRRGDADHVPPG